MKLRPATFVLSGVAAGALLAAITYRYTVGLQPPKTAVPLAALTAFIAAAAALIGIGIERYFDLRARREERRVNLLREVYFEAWEALQQEMALAVGIGSAADLGAVQEQLRRFRKAAAYSAKVFTVGSPETIQAFSDLRQTVIRSMSYFADFQIRQSFRKQLKETSAEIIKDLSEQEEQGEGSEEEKAKRQEKLSRFRAEVKKLDETDVEAVSNVLQAATKASKEFEEKLAPAVLAARKDLGLSTARDKEIAAVMKTATEKAVKAMEPLNKFGETLMDLVKISRGSDTPEAIPDVKQETPES